MSHQSANKEAVEWVYVHPLAPMSETYGSDNIWGATVSRLRLLLGEDEWDAYCDNTPIDEAEQRANDIALLRSIEEAADDARKTELAERYNLGPVHNLRLSEVETMATDAIENAPEPAEFKPIPELLPEPEFPYHILPDPVDTYLTDWATSMSLSKEMAANAFIATYSTLCNHQRHEVIAGSAGTWKQRLNLFMLIAGGPGSGKSPAIKAVIGPLSDLREKLKEESDEVRREAMSEIAVAKMERDKYHADVKHIKNPDEAKLAAFKEADQQVQRLEAQTSPKPYKLYAGGDLTPEAFAARMGSNEGNVMSLISEEGGFFSSIDRYSKPGAAPDLDALLMSFDGGAIDILRKTTGDIEIKGAYSTFLFGVQPVVLEQLFGNPLFVNRGLADRFICVMPPKIKRRRVGRQQQDILRKYEYEQWFHRHISPEFPGQQTVHIPDDVMHIYNLWADEYDDGFEQGVDLGLEVFFSKVQQVALRIAGLLHMMHRSDPSNVEVAHETMCDALDLVDYWIGYRRRFIVENELTADEEAAIKIRAYMDRFGDDRFTIRQILRSGCTGKAYGKAGDVKHLLAQMLKWGWLETSHPDNWDKNSRVAPPEFWISDRWLAVNHHSAQSPKARKQCRVPTRHQDTNDPESERRATDRGDSVLVSGGFLRKGFSTPPLEKSTNPQKSTNNTPNPPDTPTQQISSTQSSQTRHTANDPTTPDTNTHTHQLDDQTDTPHTNPTTTQIDYHETTGAAIPRKPYFLQQPPQNKEWS